MSGLLPWPLGSSVKLIVGLEGHFGKSSGGPYWTIVLYYFLDISPLDVTLGFYLLKVASGFSFGVIFGILLKAGNPRLPFWAESLRVDILACAQI